MTPYWNLKADYIARNPHNYQALLLKRDLIKKKKNNKNVTGVDSVHKTYLFLSPYLLVAISHVCRSSLPQRTCSIICLANKPPFDWLSNKYPHTRHISSLHIPRGLRHRQ